MYRKTLEFVGTLLWSNIPPHAQHAARRAVLDLLAVGASAVPMPLSQMMREHAVLCFAAGDPESAFSDDVIIDDFFEFASPPSGRDRAQAICDIVCSLGNYEQDDLTRVKHLMYAPVEPAREFTQ